LPNYFVDFFFSENFHSWFPSPACKGQISCLGASEGATRTWIGSPRPVENWPDGVELPGDRKFALPWLFPSSNLPWSALEHLRKWYHFLLICLIASCGYPLSNSKTNSKLTSNLFD
jgi:hypothetical protein